MVQSKSQWGLTSKNNLTDFSSQQKQSEWSMCIDVRANFNCICFLRLQLPVDLSGDLRKLCYVRRKKARHYFFIFSGRLRIENLLLADFIKSKINLLLRPVWSFSLLDTGRRIKFSCQKAIKFSWKFLSSSVTFCFIKWPVRSATKLPKFVEKMGTRISITTSFIRH